MTAPEFTKEFQSLMQRAMSSRVSVGHLILTLEMAKLELAYMHNVAVHQQQMHAMAQKMADESPKIIQPNN